MIASVSPRELPFDVLKLLDVEIKFDEITSCKPLVPLGENELQLLLIAVFIDFYIGFRYAWTLPLPLFPKFTLSLTFEIIALAPIEVELVELNLNKNIDGFINPFPPNLFDNSYKFYYL
mgnify:CR=1 FL=1